MVTGETRMSSGFEEVVTVLEAEALAKTPQLPQPPQTACARKSLRERYSDNLWAYNPLM